MTRPLVIQTELLDETCAQWLAERCDLVPCPQSDEPRFGELLARARGLVVRTYTTVDAAVLEHAPALKVVGRAGVGLDSIDVEACRRRGVQVVHTPDANTQAVAEYVGALLFDALRPRLLLDAPAPLEAWKSMRDGCIAGRQLSECTLGVYGMGRVGRRVARIGAGLGMRVVYNDLLDIPEPDRHGAEPVTADALLRTADVLSVHVDPRPANRHLLNIEAFARMKDDAVFINTSRGMIVDATALAAYLQDNPKSQAFVDVHEPEPFGPDYPLLGMHNARLSPHIAACTATAKRNMSWVVRDVWRVLEGEPPEFPAP